MWRVGHKGSRWPDLLPKQVVGTSAVIALCLAAGTVKWGRGQTEEELEITGARVGKRRTIICDVK